MNFPWLAARNLSRNKLRVTLTIAGVAITVVLFLVIRTVLWAWSYGAEVGAKDRIASRHKVSFILQLPKNYIDKIRQIPGVSAATWMNWFGAKEPKADQMTFATFAVDQNTFLDVYSEIVVPPEVAAAWKADPQGALIGDVQAKKMGVKPGDKITLVGTIYPGNWEFHISGIYTVTAKSWDRSSMVFHWDYLNNSLPESRRDEIGWVAARIDDPTRSADISKAIDDYFDERDIQTLTMSEKALNNSFIAMFAALLTALDYISLVILLVMALILGNTIAMGVRERTFEYGVLRAIGFLPKHVSGFILGEGAILGLAGGLAGLGLGYVIIKGIQKFVEEGPMSGWFPYFRLQWTSVVAGIGLAIFLGVLASFIPAWRASRLSVTNALRRVG
jgi:putative ABC transport system permease protein